MRRAPAAEIIDSGIAGRLGADSVSAYPPCALRQFGEPSPGLTERITRAISAAANVSAFNCRQHQAGKRAGPFPVLERKVSSNRADVLAESAGYSGSQNLELQIQIDAHGTCGTAIPELALFDSFYKRLDQSI